MDTKIKKATEIQAKQLKDSGFSQQFDTIMLDNKNVEPVGVNQANVINRGNCHTFDTSLQRDIDFKNGYSEFGPTQMHYNVEEHFDMMSSNMAPHTSHREYTNNKDYSHTLGLYTGTDPYFTSKTDGFEPVSLFEPMKDLTYVNGAPVKTDELEGRYLASNKNNYGDLPFEAEMKVQPGLFGETMAPYTVYRNLPKTIDELRSKTNQKETYKAEKIEAVQKGQYRGAPVHLTKFKKKGFKDTSVDDLLPNSAPANKRKITGKFKKPNTNRSISKDITGPAYEPTRGEVQDGKYTESGKVTYANDGITRDLTGVENKPVVLNKKSYTNKENERDSTNHNIPGTLHKPESGGYAFDPNDVPLTTLRQLMIDGDTNIGITNQDNKSYVFSNDMVLPANNRNSTVYNMMDTNVTSREKNPYTYDAKDLPKTTIKQTTIFNDKVGSVQPSKYGVHYYDSKNTARDTIRQTTSINNKEGVVTSYQKSYTLGKEDKARETVKETTELQTKTGVVSGINKKGYVLDRYDAAKETIKEQTGVLGMESNIQPDFYAPSYIDYNDIPKETVKQTTQYNTHIGGAVGENMKGYALDKNDEARETIKQQTSMLNIPAAINSNTSSIPYLNTYRKPDVTIKETTVYNENEIQNNKLAEGGLVYVKNNDKAKPTIKSSTLHSSKGWALGREDGEAGYVRDDNDKAKPTIKQSTLHSTQGGRLGRQHGEAGYSRDVNDKARPTIKSSTLHSNQGFALGREEAEAGYARDEKDIARATIRQSTLHSTQGGRLGREHGEKGYARDEKDKAKPTIRQSTLHSTQGGRLGREHGETGYSRDVNDKARVTIKQTTLLKNHTGPLQSHVDNPKTQEAEQNMTIDERREILTYSRPTGPKSDRSGPILNRKTMKLKDENFIKRDNYGYDKTSCNIGQLNKVYTRNKETLSTPNYRINNDFINTLQTNPLVNDLMHQKNTDEDE